MATVIQKLHENFLSCIICTELYKEPRTLSCGHTFCRVCLVQYTNTQQDAVKANSIPCPNCRHLTKTSSPNKSVEDWIRQLKSSFLIQGLLDDFASAEGPSITLPKCIINLIKQKEEKLRAEVDDLRKIHLGNLKGNLKSEEIDMQMYQQHCQFIDQALTVESEMDMYEMYQICQSEMIRPAADVAPADEESSDGTEMAFVEEIDEQIIATHVQLGSIKMLKKEFNPMQKGVLIDTIIIDANNDKDISNPYDVTLLVVNETYVLVVTDSRNDCLKSFYRSKGKKRHSTLNLKSSPSCVAKLNRSQLVAVSFWSHNEIVIVHVTPDLVTLSNITTQKIYKSLTALTPTTLVASCTSSVDFLDTKGNLTRSLDSIKTVQNLIKYPYFISRSLAGNILISDPGSQSLYCLTPEGKHVFTFHPTGNTALKGPRGIATTTTGDILLADYGNNKVIQLSPTGKFVRNILTSKDGIAGPYGICLHNDKLYVAEAEKNVKVFRFN